MSQQQQQQLSLLPLLLSNLFLCTFCDSSIQYSLLCPQPATGEPSADHANFLSVFAGRTRISGSCCFLLHSKGRCSAVAISGSQCGIPFQRQPVLSSTVLHVTVLFILQRRGSVRRRRNGRRRIKVGQSGRDTVTEMIRMRVIGI